jgi:hypothetical protein
MKENSWEKKVHTMHPVFLEQAGELRINILRRKEGGKKP